MEHYYTGKPTSKVIPYEFTAVLRGNELKFHTSSGVFSIKKIDRGSEVLIEYCSMEDGWRVLDLACGYGPVGIALSKAFDIDVVMTDVNERAVRLARKNADENGVDADIIKGSLYEKVDGKFDTILVNPPQTAGKDICIQMIEKAVNHLKPGGTLQLVARHNKGGKALSKVMEKVFGNVDVLARKSGYRVYLSKAP